MSKWMLGATLFLLLSLVSGCGFQTDNSTGISVQAKVIAGSPPPTSGVTVEAEHPSSGQSVKTVWSKILVEKHSWLGGGDIYNWILTGKVVKVTYYDGRTFLVFDDDKQMNITGYQPIPVKLVQLYFDSSRVYKGCKEVK